MSTAPASVGVPTPCDVPYLADTPACVVAGAAGEVADAVGTAVDFTTDPLGYIAQKMQEAAAGLSSTVLPELDRLTRPDLGQEWFISAYQVSFALAMFVFVAFVGWNFVQLARRRVSGDEVVETLTLYIPTFLGGVIFGPVAGAGLLALTGALTEALIGWGVGATVETTIAALLEAIAAGTPADVVGGPIVAMVFFAALIVSLLLAFVVLLVMVVTLYLTGVIVPLSLVWLVHPRQRAKGLKVVMVWIGICFSHVLLFLLLGVAFRMVEGLATNFQTPGVTILANLAVAVIALVLATLSPLGLLAFAPVGPSVGAGAGPAMSLPGRARVGGYTESAGDSQVAQMARDNGAAGSDAVGADSGAGAAGSTSGQLRTMSAPGAGSRASSSLMEPAGSAGRVERGTPQAPTGAGGGVRRPALPITAVGAAASAMVSGGDDTPASAPSSGDGAAGLSSGAVARQEGGSTPGRAGSAATTTGSGAPLGAALQAAGVALQAAGAAVGAVAEMAQSAGETATEPVEHGQNEHRGGGPSRPRT